MPYGYYTLLRIVICLFGFGFAALLFNKDITTWVENKAWILMAFWGLLYNPLIPIHLTREIWLPINLATICSFAFMIPLCRRINKEEKEETQKRKAENYERLKQKFDERQTLKNKRTNLIEGSSPFDPEREQYLQKRIGEFGIKISPKTGRFLKKKKSEINWEVLAEMARVYRYKFDRGLTNNDWSKFYPDEIIDWAGKHFDEDVRKELEGAANIVEDMWQHLIDNFGETHPTGENQQFAQNYRLEKVNLGSRLHYRAILEQARRFGLDDAYHRIPPGYSDILEKTDELPTPPWEK